MFSVLFKSAGWNEKLCFWFKAYRNMFCHAVPGGCATLSYSTKYSNSDIHIGESKDSVVEKYGRPYSEEILSDNGIVTEVLCYKEFMAYGYTLKTYFYFQDSVLVKKTQVDASPSEIVIKDNKK